MISSDMDFFDPLSESFQQPIQLNEYTNFASSYSSTPKFYNMNLTLDILNDSNENNLTNSGTPSNGIENSTINLRIDPRSKSGNHEFGPKSNLNQPRSNYIDGYCSPINKKPFVFTIYKDNNDKEKIKITKMGRFSITKRTHGDVSGNTNYDIQPQPVVGTQQTKPEYSLQNDLIMIC
ncbi:hypothetical protein M9Y10_041704 [Tritrichomonas musculus]|uniref:Uncharacterized protein n=1 Tax=Tritrichomonas musculus TaxID=1915356 RepID=A0ABR2K543_9EUKA